MAEDEFSGKTVLITGAGGGLGAALVDLFSKAGAKLVLCDRSTEMLEGFDWPTQAFDLADGAAVAAAAAAIIETHGAPDVVVSNAGWTRAETMASLTADNISQEIDLNLTGVATFATALLPAIAERGRGAFVFISSVNALTHFGNPAYAAAKAGINAFSRAIAVEQGRRGIRSNVVCPGSIRTPAWAHRLAKDPGIMTSLRKLYPLGRIIEATEVAEAVAFLASDRASGITGAVLPVDAGATAGYLPFIDDILGEGREITDVRFRDLSKSFGRHQVLDTVNLYIEGGEFVVLVGPSGCGKSTLLRMLAGLEPITSGELLIGGVRANDLPPQKRNIAMVFQSYALFPHMMASDNIGFGPKIRGEDKGRIAEKIKNAASILNLHSYLDRFPRQLSGGQRQRVAMGRAIVRKPSVFLFDEPLSNLDAQLRVQMRTEIKALHQRLKSTVVYVTHDQIEAMTMADRIVVMDQGRILQVGAPLELYDRPANKFVAGFIGSPSMSFLSGRISASDAGAVFEGGGARMAVGADAARGVGRDVEIGVRPEHFVVSPENPSARIEVDVVEPTGTETHVYGAIGGEKVRAVFRDRIAVRPGDRLPVSVDPRNTHVFDKATGLPV